MLPENKPVARPVAEKLTILIYGDIQTGKTHFASKFPDSIILSTDGNYANTNRPAIFLPSLYNETLPGGHVVQRTGWEKLRNTVTMLMEGKHTFRTVVLDLIEDIYELARQHFLRELGVDDEMDVKFGKGYDRIRKAFYQIIIDLKSCMDNVIIISHQKNIAGQKSPTPEWVPALSDKVLNKVRGYTTLEIYQTKMAGADGKSVYWSYLESVSPFAGYRYTWHLNIPYPFAIPSDYNTLKQILQSNAEAKAEYEKSLGTIPQQTENQGEI